jgi:hypothetical protein
MTYSDLDLFTRLVTSWLKWVIFQCGKGEGKRRKKGGGQWAGSCFPRFYAKKNIVGWDRTLATHMIEGTTYHYTTMTYCYISYNIYIYNINIYYILERRLLIIGFQKPNNR